MTCRPDRCHHELRIGSVVVHTCNELFMKPLEPVRTLRLVKAAS
jgi:hypothetical protein